MEQRGPCCRIFHFPGVRILLEAGEVGTRTLILCSEIVIIIDDSEHPLLRKPLYRRGQEHRLCNY